jgi:L-2-hydroxyglutarate oxidase
MKESYDVAVIGAGIVGVSIGIELLIANPKLRVILLEKEMDLGFHASGRNSGVLHAGFYYSSESLKAKYCIEGNQLLRNLVSKHGLPILKSGKVVIAKNEEERARLKSLYERGIANGVDVELLPSSELHKYEPLARSEFEFLWSPNTAVVNQQSVLSALKRDFEKLGGYSKMSTPVNLFEKNERVVFRDLDLSARFIINSAGSYALSLANQVSAGLNFGLIPVRGAYRATLQKYLPLRTLVYPVPHPINPFLGVHFTPNTLGQIKIGPTALPVLGNEQYSFSEWPNFSELIKNLANLVRYGIRNPRESKEIVLSEFEYLKIDSLLEEGRQLVPSVPNSSHWKTLAPGIRAQLIDKSSGKFVSDFLVEKRHNSLHLLNIVSPGFTSALPLAKSAAKQAIDMIKSN